MARVQEFYKGKRKRRNYAFLPFLILLTVISVILVLFYGMQKYAVISKDGVAIRLPILEDGQSTTVDSEGHVVREFEAVSVPLVFEEADYSYVRSKAGEYAPPVRAIFVPAENVNSNKIIEYAARLVAGNALMLEMKPRSGQTLWESHTHMAEAYSLTMQNDITAAMPEMIQMLKEKDIYLVAEISCCIDELLPTRTTAYCIHTETGLNYTDGLGTWLDPYSLDGSSGISALTRSCSRTWPTPRWRRRSRFCTRGRSRRPAPRRPRSAVWPRAWPTGSMTGRTRPCRSGATRARRWCATT